MVHSFVVAQHNSEGRLILTVCDRNVHGKRFEENDVVLDLSSKFYSGTIRTAEETEELIKSAYIISAVGDEAVKMAVRLGLASREDAKTLAGVKHVQVLRF